MSRGTRSFANSIKDANFLGLHELPSEEVKRPNRRDLTAEHRQSKSPAQPISAPVSKTPHSHKTESRPPIKSILKKSSLVNLARKPSVTLVDPQSPSKVLDGSSPMNSNEFFEFQHSSRTHEALASYEEQNTAKYQELSVYSQVFDDIIKQDNLYGALLVNVKNKYDEFILSISEEVSYLRQSSSQIGDSAHTKIASLKKKIHSLNSSLSERQKTVQEFEREREHLRDMLNSEKEKYTEAAATILQELRETKLMEAKLRNDLEGFRGREQGQVQVPPLKIPQVSSRESTDSSSPSPSVVSVSAKRTVPLLSIPESQQEQFQDEFLANYSDFSESWRQQVDQMKRL